MFLRFSILFLLATLIYTTNCRSLLGRGVGEKITPVSRNSDPLSTDPPTCSNYFLIYPLSVRHMPHCNRRTTKFRCKRCPNGNNAAGCTELQTSEVQTRYNCPEGVIRNNVAFRFESNGTVTPGIHLECEFENSRGFKFIIPMTEFPEANDIVTKSFEAPKPPAAASSTPAENARDNAPFTIEANLGHWCLNRGSPPPPNMFILNGDNGPTREQQDLPTRDDTPVRRS